MAYFKLGVKSGDHKALHSWRRNIQLAGSINEISVENSAESRLMGPKVEM